MIDSLSAAFDSAGAAFDRTFEIYRTTDARQRANAARRGNTAGTLHLTEGIISQDQAAVGQAFADHHHALRLSTEIDDPTQRTEIERRAHSGIADCLRTMSAQIDLTGTGSEGAVFVELEAAAYYHERAAS